MTVKVQHFLSVLLEKHSLFFFFGIKNYIFQKLSFTKFYMNLVQNNQLTPYK